MYKFKGRRNKNSFISIFHISTGLFVTREGEEERMRRKNEKGRIQGKKLDSLSLHLESLLELKKSLFKVTGLSLSLFQKSRPVFLFFHPVLHGLNESIRLAPLS